MKLSDINCPPYAPVLMESTRDIGYSIESAIADILDNSIAAKAKTIAIYFNCNPSPYIAIIDDGVGMKGDKLTEAMRYGSTNPVDERSSDDLGRYGLGLKTASLSQCRSLTVISKQGDSIEGRRWSLDHIQQTKMWSLEQLDDNEIKNQIEIEKMMGLTSGTMVLWKELDKLKKGSLTFDRALEEKMESVQKHLELVFHRYLSGDGVSKIQMFMNGNKLVPFDPFFVTKSTVVMDDEKIEIPGRAGKVVIRPFVLPHPSKMTREELEKYGGKDGLRNLQGFYIYRNKRLLTWGTWFKLMKMDEFSKLARVRVDIPNSLDDLWTLDVKKSTAYPPEIVKIRLKQLVKTMSDGSRRTWTFRQRKEISNKVVHIWDKVETREGVKYIVNMDHPSLAAIKNTMDEDSIKLLDNYLKIVQNNLPFNNLHMDLQSDVKIAQEKESDERTTVRILAKNLIREAVKNGSVQNTMDTFKILEPFMYYMEDVEEVYEEVKRNG